MALFSIGEVSAHCDIPCGIYETDTMQHAADTCAKMVAMILDLGAIDNTEKMNTFVRLVSIKEQHAERVKHELAVLWGDYFKPEHLESHADLHDTIWKALKQASAVKRSVSHEEAEKLQVAVKAVAQIFADTKK